MDIFVTAKSPHLTPFEVLKLSNNTIIMTDERASVVMLHRDASFVYNYMMSIKKPLTCLMFVLKMLNIFSKIVVKDCVAVPTPAMPVHTVVFNVHL